MVTWRWRPPGYEARRSLSGWLDEDLRGSSRRRSTLHVLMAIGKDRRALWRRGSARTDRVGVVGSEAAQDSGWRAHKPQFPCEVGQNAGAEGGRRGVAARRRGPFGVPPMRPARRYAGAAVLIFGERGGRKRDVRASIEELDRRASVARRTCGPLAGIKPTQTVGAVENSCAHPETANKIPPMDRRGSLVHCPTACGSLRSPRR